MTTWSQDKAKNLLPDFFFWMNVSFMTTQCGQDQCGHSNVCNVTSYQANGMHIHEMTPVNSNLVRSALTTDYILGYFYRFMFTKMTRPGEKNSFIFLSFPINLPLYKISSPACRWHCSGPSCPHNKQGPGTSIITLSYKELKSPSQCNRFWKFISLNSAMTLTWPWYNVHC